MKNKEKLPPVDLGRVKQLNEGIKKKPKLGLFRSIERFLYGARHDYDLDNPLVDHIETTHKHSINNDTQKKKWTITGFQCSKCDKILWLDKWQMKNLPKSMKYGCTENNI